MGLQVQKMCSEDSRRHGYQRSGSARNKTFETEQQRDHDRCKGYRWQGGFGQSLEDCEQVVKDVPSAK